MASGASAENPPRKNIFIFSTLCPSLLSVFSPAHEAEVPLHVVPVSAAQVSHHGRRAALPSPKLRPGQSAGWFCLSVTCRDGK